MFDARQKHINRVCIREKISFCFILSCNFVFPWPGYDKVQLRFTKPGGKQIIIAGKYCQYLNVYKLWFSFTCIFLNNCKLAWVTSVYGNNGDRNFMSNHHPVSVIDGTMAKLVGTISTITVCCVSKRIPLQLANLLTWNAVLTGFWI